MPLCRWSSVTTSPSLGGWALLYRGTSQRQIHSLCSFYASKHPKAQVLLSSIKVGVGNSSSPGTPVVPVQSFFSPSPHLSLPLPPAVRRLVSSRLDSTRLILSTTPLHLNIGTLRYHEAKTQTRHHLRLLFSALDHRQRHKQSSVNDQRLLCWEMLYCGLESAQLVRQ